jgi:outer membrane protein OmpA-like peptidoglycan-associated protein
MAMETDTMISFVATGEVLVMILSRGPTSILPRATAVEGPARRARPAFERAPAAFPQVLRGMPGRPPPSWPPRMRRRAGREKKRRDGTAIAAETARLKTAEASVAAANAERDRVRLEARAREAERAQRDAAQAQREAEHARGQAEATRREALAAQERAAGAEREAEAARRQAESAQAHARSLQAELAELHARPSDRGMVVTLGDLLFDTGRAELAPGAARIVDRLADFLREYPQRRVSIEGFTDSVGSAAANRELSERRAAAVRHALIERGIAATRIVARGYGEEFPVASNGNAAGRQMNRRVEIVISDEQGTIGARGSAPPGTPAGAPPG